MLCTKEDSKKAMQLTAADWYWNSFLNMSIARLCVVGMCSVEYTSNACGDV